METSNTQKAIKGMSSQTLVTLVLGIIEIFSFSIMSRLLSADDFGYYAAIVAVTTVFACFSDAGIGSAIIQKKDISQKFINVAFTVSFVCGSIAMVALLILAKPLAYFVADESMTVPLMLISLTLLGQCLTSVNTSIMIRRLEFLKVGMINLFALVVTTIIAVWLAYLGFGYYAIITRAILTSILTYIVSYYYAKTKFSFSWDKKTFKGILGFSGWLTASGFFRDLSNQLDRLLMTSLLSITALGQYNRPKDFISQITVRVGNIFDTALFPVLSQIQDDKLGMKRAYIRSMYYLNMASLVLAVGFVCNAELIIRIFFGQDWFNIVSIFMVLSLSVIFVFDARMADCYLRSLGWTKQQFFFRIMEVALKFAGLLIGFRYGLLGVAISVLITSIIAVVIKHIYIAKRINVNASETIAVLIKSWKSGLIFAPTIGGMLILLPKTIVSELILLVVYILLVLVTFVLFPSMAGSMYKNDMYPKVISTVKNKLRKNV